jgi:hypothetical protein
VIKLLPYVLRSAFRNKVRTALTVLGIGTAVFLVTGLAAILESHENALAGASQTTLVVSEKDVY